MRRRFPTAAILAALLAVYLGLPCLALAQVHSAMGRDHEAMGQNHDAMPRETAAGPCETSGTSEAELLCTAPAAYVPLAAALPEIGATVLAPAALPPVLAAAQGAAPASPTPVLCGAHPPAFLLHATLLI